VRANSFSAIPTASAPIFMFCAPRHVFGGAEGVKSRFHVSRSRTRFRRFRGHQVPFSWFTSPYSFSAVSRASDPVFMFCAPELVFGGTYGVESLFHVLHFQIRFRRFRGHRVPFSSFATSYSFSMVPRAWGPIFIFCAPGIIFGRTEGVGTRFHILPARTHFRRYRGHRVPFSGFARPDSFSTLPWASVPFSCFAIPGSFSSVRRASGPVLMFCVPILIFDGSEGVMSRFHVLCPRTSFRRYSGRQVPFSCFARSNSVLAVPTASGPNFMFCAPGNFFGGAEGVGSRFHVLHFQTCFRLFRWRRVPFSCFASPYSFSMVPRASGLDFMFCAAVHFFGGAEGVGSRFHVLHFQTCF
jgi:hypothetical protein